VRLVVLAVADARVVVGVQVLQDKEITVLPDLHLMAQAVVVLVLLVVLVMVGQVYRTQLFVRCCHISTHLPSLPVAVVAVALPHLLQVERVAVATVVGLTLLALAELLTLVAVVVVLVKIKPAHSRRCSLEVLAVQGS
jgi:hypothetical protein